MYKKGASAETALAADLLQLMMQHWCVAQVAGLECTLGSITAWACHEAVCAGVMHSVSLWCAEAICMVQGKESARHSAAIEPGWQCPVYRLNFTCNHCMGHHTIIVLLANGWYHEWSIGSLACAAA
jgi:hypothetical protein